MGVELPPFVKVSERLLVEIEQAVARWPRYHKYAHGTTLRTQAMGVTRLAHRAWRRQRQEPQLAQELIHEVDGLKVSLQLGQQIGAFVSFAQFESVIRIAVDLGRQCGGWAKSRRFEGQHATETPEPAQSALILSTRAASHEANL